MSKEGRQRRLVWVALLALMAHALLLQQLWGVGVSEDTAITLRVSRNLARGLGPVFNPGERVEAYTNPLWMLLCAGAEALGLPSDRFAGPAALACLAGLVWLVGTAAPAAAPAAFLLALSTPVVSLALSGMETMLLALVAGAGALALARGKLPAAGALFGLASLTRADGAVFGLIAAAFPVVDVLASRRRMRELTGFLLPFLLLTVAWPLYRLWYYGYPLPNTYYAKQGIPLPWLLSFGAAYGAAFLRTHWGVVGALAITLADQLARRDRRAAVSTVAVCGGLTAFVLATGGDNQSAGMRFWLPVVVLSAFLAPRIPTVRLRVAALALLAVWLVAADRRAMLDLADFERSSLPGGYATVGDAFARGLPPETRVALGPIGLIGYRSGLPLIDLLGLADAEIARSGDLTDKSAGKGHVRTGYRIALGRRPEAFWLQQIVPRGTDLTAIAWRSSDRRLLELVTDPVFRGTYVPAALGLTPALETIVFVRNDVAAALHADARHGRHWRIPSEEP